MSGVQAVQRFVTTRRFVPSNQTGISVVAVYQPKEVFVPSVVDFTTVFVNVVVFVRSIVKYHC